MSTTEDFRNAPIGATATHSDGGRAMKMDYVERRWIVPNGFCLDDEEMERRDYTLDPLPPLPPFPLFPHITAREALELAWELAHPIKKGQVIPEGTRLIVRDGYDLFREDETLEEWNHDTPPTGKIRTLDPLPEPGPDWLDAPAVMARLGNWISCADPQVFVRETETQWLRGTGVYHWTELMDVTPLWPKEEA